MAMTDFHLANHVDLSSLRTIGTVPYDDTQLVDDAQFSGSHPGVHVNEATGEKMIVNWVGVPGVIKKCVWAAVPRVGNVGEVEANVTWRIAAL